MSEPARFLEFHFTSLAHDLTVHALNYHLIPRDCWAELMADLTAALPERYSSWEANPSEGPLTLTFFFDNDLNRYCYAIWCRSKTAEDFPRLFRAEGNLSQLRQVLHTRIQETIAGIGDVPSGDTDDMQPLTMLDFRVKA